MIMGRFAAKWASTENLQPLPAISAAMQSVLTDERGMR
jgi:hypothetical protein